MSTIQPLGTSQTSPYSRGGREVSRIVERTEVAVVKTAAIAHIETAKLDALQAITGRAMQGITLIGQLEQSLVTAVPIVSGRLQLVGDTHAMASAEVVSSAPRKLS